MTKILIRGLMMIVTIVLVETVIDTVKMRMRDIIVNDDETCVMNMIPDDDVYMYPPSITAARY